MYDGKTPYTAVQVIQKAYYVVLSSGLYVDVCKEWRKISSNKKTWIGFDIFCRRISQPQAHPEDELSTDGISQRNLYGPDWVHILCSQQPLLGHNRGPESRWPADGKNLPADRDEKYPGGPDKTAG